MSFSFYRFDPDGDALTYTWDLGDGTAGSGAALPTSHTYDDDGVYTISLTASDGSVTSDVASTTATISNVAPSATFISLSQIDEGSAAILTLSNPTDPSSTDVAAGRPFPDQDLGQGNGSGRLRQPDGRCRRRSCVHGHHPRKHRDP